MGAKRSPMSPLRAGVLRAANLFDRPSPVRVDAPAPRQHDRFMHTAVPNSMELVAGNNMYRCLMP